MKISQRILLLSLTLLEYFEFVLATCSFPQFLLRSGCIFCFCHALPACGNCGDCHCNMVDIATTSHSSNVTPQGNSISGKQDNYEHVKCCDKSHAALHLRHFQWAAAAAAAAFLSHDWGIKLANKFSLWASGEGRELWLTFEKSCSFSWLTHTHTHAHVMWL